MLFERWVSFAPVSVDDMPATVINPASEEFGQALSEAGSDIDASKLSHAERIFCDVFVGNGGKATEAALAAGYAEGSAHVAASRLLCRKRVGDYISKLCHQFAHTGLPVAIKALIEIAGDPEALRKDRIKAANSLVEMAGLMPHGPGVQVNVGVSVNGQQAQALIGEVWDAKQRRMSDIPTAMSDNIRTIQGEVERLEDEAGGGDAIKGPAPRLLPLPPSSSADASKSDVSPLAAWRQATGGDDAQAD